MPSSNLPIQFNQPSNTAAVRSSFRNTAISHSSSHTRILPKLTKFVLSFGTLAIVFKNAVSLSNANTDASIVDISSVVNRVGHSVLTGNIFSALALNIASRSFKYNPSSHVNTKHPAFPGGDATIEQKLAFREVQLKHLEESKTYLQNKTPDSNSIEQILRDQDMRTLDRSMNSVKAIIKAYKGAPTQAIRDLESLNMQYDNDMAEQTNIINDETRTLQERVEASTEKANIQASKNNNVNIFIVGIQKQMNAGNIRDMNN
jgi:hypothetical protein